MLTASKELGTGSQEPLLEVTITKDLALTKGHATELLRGRAASEGVVSSWYAEAAHVLGCTFEQ